MNSVYIKQNGIEKGQWFFNVLNVEQLYTKCLYGSICLLLTFEDSTTQILHEVELFNICKK